MKSLAVIAAELEAYVYYLLDTHNLWSDDGTYTFPNGDTWRKDRT